MQVLIHSLWIIVSKDVNRDDYKYLSYPRIAYDDEIEARRHCQKDQMAISLFEYLNWISS